MPAHADVTSAVERQLLLQLGQRLKRARVNRSMSLADLAQQVGISRTTLYAVEAGEPTPTMGTYIRVLAALGLAADLALIATGESSSQPKSELVSLEDGRHAPQDLLSLMLHKEAVKLLRRYPSLRGKAQETLQRWQKTGNAQSMPLWDEWARILEKRNWRRVVANTERGKQLRQASPLSTLLPEETRERVMSEVRALRHGQAPSEGGGAVPPGRRERGRATA